MFDFLTLSVVIDDRIFCVHGGKTQILPWRPTLIFILHWQDFPRPYIPLIKSKLLIDSEVRYAANTLSAFAQVALYAEIPHEGPMADLVWSDPDPEKEDFAISPRFVPLAFTFII